MIEPWFSQELAPWLSLLSLFSLLSYCNVWAQKGRNKELVLTLYKGSVALGVLLVLAGGMALLNGQPYWVWFSLLLAGGLLGGIMMWGTYQMIKVYEEAELRKTIASDL